MEKDLLQCRDPLPKTIATPCCILSGRKNKYGNKDTRLTEANDNIAFVTPGNEEKKGNKKKR